MNTQTAISDLSQAKALVQSKLADALPPNLSTPQLFTLPDLITKPVYGSNVLDVIAHKIIAGTFLPATSTRLDGWSTSSIFADTFLRMIQDMQWKTSTADQNTIDSIMIDNDQVLTDLVNLWEKTFAPITPQELKEAHAPSKADYVVAQFTPDFRKTISWSKFAPLWNSAAANLQILQNLNSAKMTFGQKITAIADHIQNPDNDPAHVQAFDNNNGKEWYPGYNIDQDFPSKFNNGQTVTVTVDLTDVGTSSSSFSIDGKVGGSFPIEFLRISGSSSAEYQESDFQSLMRNVKVELTFNNVSYLSASPANLTSNYKLGWYAADLLKEACANDGTQTGPYFATSSAQHKQVLQAGGLQSLEGLLVASMPTGKMSFVSEDYAAFEKYFHTQSNASVSLFGFIPLASASTSYTKSSSGSSSQGYKMDVTINPSGDKNHITVLGAALENPLG